MTETVVVDASLAAMWSVPEPHSEQALRLAARWARTGTRLLAPCLLVAELTNALYRRIVRGELNLARGQEALAVALGFPIQLREEPGLPARTLAMGHQLGRRNTYDCHYLALAENYQCELWTGDRRFYSAVKAKFPRVKWIGEYSLPRGL